MIKLISLFFAGIITSLTLVGVVSLFGPMYASAAFNPSGGGTYRLGQSIGTSDSTIRLSSFKEPVSSIPYTMTYLGSSKGYGTISPQSSISEFISFTGITQNSDGSATLTGVTRGLSRTPAGSACVASTTLATAHPGQSIFILSNSPCFYSEYAIKQNNETIPGNWTFSGQATFSTAPISTSNSTTSYTTAGIGQLATPAEQAASTATSSNGNSSPLFLASKNATSTYNSQTAGNVAVITKSTGRIDANFLASSTNNTATTSLQMDSSGNSYWLPISRILLPSSFNTNTVSNGTSTVFKATVPANALGATGMIRVKLYGVVGGPAAVYRFDLAYGTTGSTTFMYNTTAATEPQPFTLEYVLQANNATNAQKALISFGSFASTTASALLDTATLPPFGYRGATSTPAIDSTVAQTLQFMPATSGSGAAMSFDLMTLEILR